MKTYTTNKIAKILNELQNKCPRGTQQRIASALGIKRQYVWNALNGEYGWKIPSVIKILQWAELFIKEEND